MLYKYIIYFILFFGLLYSENFDFAGISFSQLWKMPLIVILIFHFIRHIKVKKPAFQKLSIWYSVKMLFNSNLTYRPFSNITEFARFLPLPLLFEYFKRKSGNTISLWLLFLSQFIILSSIPFHLGLIESVGKQVSLLGFGYTDTFGHTGIFQGAHAASTTYTLAVIVLINNFFKISSAEKKQFYNNKPYNILLIGLAVYSIYAGFVRTGYLMFTVALIVYIFSSFKFTLKHIAITLLSMIILVGGILYLIQTNDVFSARLFDERITGDNSIGSGRLIFWANAYDRWSNGNIFEIIFGIGMDNFKEYQYQKIGLRIFSHSQFFDSLVQNGIIGILLYLFMLLSLFRFIRSRKQQDGYRLSLSLFIAYLMFALVQGSSLFLPDLLFALSLANLFANKERVIQY